MALGGDIVPSGSLHSDWYYGLYLRLITVFDELDLNQIQLITTFLSDPDAAKHIPEEFWSHTLVKSLKGALDHFSTLDDVDE